MIAVVNSQATVRTAEKWCFITTAAQVIQPHLSCTTAVGAAKISTGSPVHYYYYYYYYLACAFDCCLSETYVYPFTPVQLHMSMTLWKIIASRNLIKLTILRYTVEQWIDQNGSEEPVCSFSNHCLRTYVFFCYYSSSSVKVGVNKSTSRLAFRLK